VAGALLIGDAGQGELSVFNGATVAASSIDAGVRAGASGNIIVSGTNSVLTATGQFTVGDTAAADVALNNGGTINAGQLDIGLNRGASGILDVEGASLVNVTGAFNVGDAGNAVLSLGALASVNAGSFNIGPAGVLVEFGDPISAGTVTNSNSIVIAGGVNTTNASARFVNNGLVEVQNGGTETINTPLVTGTGQVQLSGGGQVVLNAGSVVPTQAVVFEDATGTLVIGAGDIGGFGAVIQGFALGDSIIVNGVAGFGDSIDATGSVLTVFGNGVSVGALAFAGGITPAEAAQVQCFAAGTRIRCDRGEVAVEDVRAGDRAWSVLGQTYAPVVWVGHRHVDCARHPRPQAVWPVRVSAGALGPGIPARDAWLSPDHAVYIDGVLVPVRHLANGGSIAQERRDSVTYYHVELDRHDVILAEGLPAESYLDTGGRSNFANGGGVTALHPDFGRAGDVWEMAGCAPLVVTGPELEGIKKTLEAAAHGAGSAHAASNPDAVTAAIEPARTPAISSRRVC
jgi:T5SS/PEP-CTERM-associated repeat protein